MSLRKAPAIDEAKFTQFINPKRKPSSNTRSTVLLRLNPDLLERLDTRAAKERLNRHALIVEILEISLKGRK